MKEFISHWACGEDSSSLDFVFTEVGQGMKISALTRVGLHLSLVFLRGLTEAKVTG